MSSDCQDLTLARLDLGRQDEVTLSYDPLAYRWSCGRCLDGKTRGRYVLVGP